MSKNIQVLLVGESYTATRIHTKGFDTIEFGSYEDNSFYLRDPLKKFDDIDFHHLPNHMVTRAYPQTLEEMFKYDVIMISDCGINNLIMYPDMFKVPMGPDRVQLTAEYVRKGGALIMPGGWVDFQGFQGKGGYHGSAIEEVLPVNISPIDDRVETPQGASVKVLSTDHPILEHIPQSWPEFLGYQRVMPKENSETLATIGKDDPFIVVGEEGKGRSMAFTSDIAPHWGTDFVTWDYYGQFWYQTFRWLTRK